MKTIALACGFSMLLQGLLGVSSAPAADRVLLPLVLTEGALGENGARWKTELIIENAGDADAELPSPEVAPSISTWW